MKIRTDHKLTIAASVLLLATGQASLVQAADDSYPYPAAGTQESTGQSYTQQGGAGMAQQPQGMQGYGDPGYGAPGYNAPGYSRPYYGGNRGYGRDPGYPSTGNSYGGPWGAGGRGFDAPYSGRDRGGPSFSGPWDSGRGGNNMPWDSGRGGSSMPWDSGRGGGSSMPWDSGRGGGSSMPWDRGRGGNSMPWGGRGGRGDWMDKDRFADRWDDMQNAPSDMGEMPGGWTAPSISTPNPVDVGDEFGDASRDVPGQMRNVYDDNRQNNR